MADDIRLEINTKQLEQQLMRLPEKVRNKYMNAALQAGGDVLLQEMVAQAPERSDDIPGGNSLPPGVLRADLHTQLRGGQIIVGPSEVAGHVARWQDEGYILTSHGRSKAGRKQIKAIPGKHFMAGTVDVAGASAVDAFVQSLANALEMKDE